MHRLWFPEHGLRIAVAALVTLAIAPAAAADDGLPVTADPLALAAVLVEPAVSDPTALDPAALVATVTEALPDELPTLPATEAVPAAAAEPMPALEPQPTPLSTPPPPQPAVEPEATDAAPDPIATASQELDSSPKPQPAAVEEPQYQPEAPQYQPPHQAAAAPEPATVPVEQELTWNGASNCGADASSAALVATVEGAPPQVSGWNGETYCDEPLAYLVNNVPQNIVQYHAGIARYQQLIVTMAVETVGAGVAAPLALATKLVVVGADVVIAAAHGPPDLVAPVAPRFASSEAPGADAPPRPDPAIRTPPHRRTAASTTKPFSNWKPRPAMPRRLQHQPDGHRSRSPLRQPTRPPLPPLRGPVIPVSSSGAAPLGGADGGGFHLTLLLAPFALALVDSARRVTRDAAPPVVRERDKRRERPG